MAFTSHIIDLYSFKQSIIDCIMLGVQPRFMLLIAFDFPQLLNGIIAHALCIESLTELTREGESKCCKKVVLARRVTLFSKPS